MFLGDGQINLSYTDSSQTYKVTVSTPQWQAGTAYVLGDVVEPEVLNGHTYVCTTAGTSGVAEPNFPTTAGATVDDGSVVWTEQPVTTPTASMTWGVAAPGQTYSTVDNVGTVAIQTLGGTDSVTVSGDPNSTDPAYKFPDTVDVIDGGTAARHGDVTIDATDFAGIATLQGGLGNDTIRISDQLGTGSQVNAGAGDKQYNELDVVSAANADITEGPDASGQESIQTKYGVSLGGKNFQKLVVMVGSGSNTVNVDGILIPTVTVIGGSGSNTFNTFNATGGTVTLIGGGGTLGAGAASQNIFNLSGSGDYTAIGGSGPNQFNVGSNPIQMNLTYAGISTLLGGLGDNVFNVSPGLTSGATVNMYGGLGSNVYNLTTNAGDDYYVSGYGASNQLNVTLPKANNTLALTQSGVTITFWYATANGEPRFGSWATNMSGVTVYGSQSGGNTLDASGMTTQGIDLIGYGTQNSLYGGQGDDTLEVLPSTLQGVAWDNNSLKAGNGNDILYFSGDMSTYVGTDSNTLVYRANPNDNVVVFQNGLNVYNSQTQTEFQSTNENMADNSPYSGQPSLLGGCQLLP